MCSLVSLALVASSSLPAVAASNRLVNPVSGVDSGDCTINKCKTIVYAHGQAVAGDTIVLDAGTYPEKPVITKAVTIQGAGQATTLIGTTVPSVGVTLTILVGAANAITLSAVTIRNGVGGLFLQTGSATVNDTTVTNNTGTTSGAGVIVNTLVNAPSMTLNNCTLQNNTANRGGGLFTAGGKVVMTGGQVTNNTANAIAGNVNTGFGGGIYNVSTAVPVGLTLSGVNVAGNKAVAAGTIAATGGGIYNGGTAAIGANGPTATTISGNTAQSTGTTAGNGGGINNAGTAAITASISTNVATNGAGLYNLGTANVTDSSISGNTANVASTVAANGGGVFNTGTTTATGTTTLGNTTVTSNSANNGGGILNFGIFAPGSKVTVTGGQIASNSAKAIAGNINTGFGGGVYSHSSGTPAMSLSGVDVSGNQAIPAGTIAGTGGGVYNGTNGEIIDSSIVSGNSATNGGGVYNAGTVKVIGMLATNSATTGGGIYNTGTATVEGGSITGNIANNGGTVAGSGGGIYNTGTTTVTDGSITDNAANNAGSTAGNGGGVYNTGTSSAAGQLTLSGTTVSGNTANNGAGILNLSFLVPGAKVAVTGGQIASNTASAIAGNAGTGFGGGVFSLAAGAPALSLSGVAVSGNKAVPAGTVVGTGGGVFNATAAAIVAGSTVEGNSATNGGGVYNNSTGALTLDASALTGNAAVPLAGVSSGFGGGLYNNSTTNPPNPTVFGTVNSTSTDFTSNTAADGAGVFNLAKFTASGGQVSDNTVTAVAGATATGFGGGVYSVSSASPGLVLGGVTIEGNRALTGGSGSSTVLGNGGGVLNFGFATISSPSFADNTATGSGGGLYNFAGTTTVVSTPFTGNFAPGFGGTIYDTAASSGGNPTVKLTDSPITGTGALSFVGGGIALGPNAKLETLGGSITGSKAISAGGLYVPEGAQATLDHTPVTGNTAEGGFGGGIYNGGTTSATDGEISGNTAIPNPGNSQTGFGGGVYSASTSATPKLTLNRVTLAENLANAASAVLSSGPASIRRSTITENIAGPSFGAIVSSGPLTLANDTFNGNSGGLGAGGLVQFGSIPVGIAGSVIAQNGPINCSGPINDGGHNLTDTTGSGSCPFTNNAVIGDPKLNDLGDNGGPTRTELPKNDSPVINKIPVDTPVSFTDAVSAASITLCPSGGSLDQRGVAAPQGSSCDIGSVELSGIVAPTLTGPDNALFITGTPNSVGFTYTGVPQPSVTISGDALPSGVTFTDNGDGTASLAGTAAPGTAGTYQFTITASNGEQPDATIDFTLTVIEPLTITTTALPEGTPGTPYAAQLAATGGTTPYTWSLASGTLPPGLSLAPGGAISGTPTTRGIYTFTVQVSDSTDPVQTATKQLTIAIRSDTALKAEPAVLKIALPTIRVSFVRLEARLTELPSNAPVAGQIILFKAGSQQVCTAVTNSNGVARCNDVTTIGVEIPVLLALGYDAYFNGTQTLRPSSGHGTLTSLGL